MSSSPTDLLFLPHPPTQQVLDTLDKIIESRLLVNPKGYADMVRCIVETRLYLCNTPGSIDELWNTIRRSQNLVDFVMDATREFYVRTVDVEGMNSRPYATMAIHLAQSLIGFVDAKSSVDQDLLTQVNHNDLIDLLTANPWLVMLNLASMVPCVVTPVSVLTVKSDDQSEPRRE